LRSRREREPRDPMVGGREVRPQKLRSRVSREERLPTELGRDCRLAFPEGSE
jgi:hypothetical protein